MFDVITLIKYFLMDPDYLPALRNVDMMTSGIIFSGF